MLGQDAACARWRGRNDGLTFGLLLEPADEIRDALARSLIRQRPGGMRTSTSALEEGRRRSDERTFSLVVFVQSWRAITWV